LIDYFREAGVTPIPCSAPCDAPVAKITADYARFLSQQRGLSRATLNNYLPIAGRFLETRFGSGPVSLSKLRVVDITRFMLNEAWRVGSNQARRVASPLRCFLRFLTQEGKVAANLAIGVPRVAHWRLSELPQFLEPEEVESLLSRSHRNTPAGRRDYAVLLLSARLGLRASEVVRLQLEDINWQAGEILIRGKGAREDRLPLLNEIGQALAEYLKNDRPCCACRRVFLRMNAPRQGFSSSVAIGNILGRALVRAHLHPEHRGCHLLRRSLATTMLRRGASLSQIGQVLRHQRAQTTEIYAKVDVAALRALALPWPTRV